MLAVPIVDMSGASVGEAQVDPAWLGGRVRLALLKQAVVTYEDHQRQFSARTKRRSDVSGSTHKLFRQKGTGNARMGAIRTPVRRGGGRAFGKRRPDGFKGLPKKMARLARDSAILAKMQADDVVIVKGLAADAPKTKLFAAAFKAMGVCKGCLVALGERDRNVFLSVRNIPKTTVRTVDELNAYEILLRKKLVLSDKAFDRLVASRKEAAGA